jgi:1,4-dihydroxy-2-naphthoate octaprenyltransferase
LATPLQWFAASRPRTLPAAIVPVLVGIAIAHAYGHVYWIRATLTLAVSLLIQIGTNYANDYSDGVRGTDAVRVGPVRLVAGGLGAPKLVLGAALGSFVLAGVFGLVVAIMTSLWILVVGAAAIAAGWYYTGGKHPYGYAGYGEIFVFVFFGLVSVIGSTYATAGHIPAVAYVAAIPVGLLTVALLVINNLRDIPTDTQVGKRTLAVKMGEAATRRLYISLVVVAFTFVPLVALFRPVALVAFISVAIARRPVALVRAGTIGRGLIPALASTGALLMSFGLLLAAGIAL